MPNIITVTGRPCTPCDQASVKSMNKLVKHVLAMLESDVRMSGIGPNWMNLLGHTMTASKYQKTYRRYAETGYNAAFGQEYHHHLECSNLDPCESTAIEERHLVTDDSRLEEVTKVHFFFGRKVWR